jgi:type III pantothenate kinase
MIYAIDIGNTNITAGIVRNKIVLCSWRLSTHPHRTSDEFSLVISQLLASSQISHQQISSSIISSVVPHMIEPVRSSLSHLFRNDPFIVQPGIRLNLNIHYNKPQDVGADRIVNAVAAKVLYGFPVVVLDFGTATTFCVIDDQGDYIGGAIFPGIQTLSSALSMSTALLPRVAFKDPGRVIGNSTQTSIQAGLFYGYADMINGMIKRILSTLDEKTKVIVTGGLAGLFCSMSGRIDIFEPDLTLIGLELIHELNSGNEDVKGMVWDHS